MSTVNNSVVKYGSVDVGSGNTSLTVTGAGFASVPVSIIPTLVKPSGDNDNFSVTLRNDSITVDGFSVDFGGVINSSGYKLTYIAIISLAPIVIPDGPDVSSSTGLAFYSGTFKDIVDIVSLLNIGEGKMDKIDRAMVNRYQEMVDRSIDDILSEVYFVPLRKMNRMMPDGNVRKTFPGEVTRAARYWTAGLLMMNEFQQLATNVTEQVNSYVKEATDGIYELKRPTHFLYGQRRKSSLSRTCPPSMAPASTPQVLR